MTNYPVPVPVPVSWPLGFGSTAASNTTNTNGSGYGGSASDKRQRNKGKQEALKREKGTWKDWQTELEDFLKQKHVAAAEDANDENEAKVCNKCTRRVMYGRFVFEKNEKEIVEN